MKRVALALNNHSTDSVAKANVCIEVPQKNDHSSWTKPQSVQRQPWKVDGIQELHGVVAIILLGSFGDLIDTEVVNNGFGKKVLKNLIIAGVNYIVLWR